MTETEQRIACALACGWRFIRDAFDTRTKETWQVFEKEGRIGSIKTDTLPDFLNDLNAMNEAEQTMTPKEHGLFRDYLAKETTVERFPTDDMEALCYSAKNERAYISSTAAQRAASFLKSKGLWK